MDTVYEVGCTTYYEDIVDGDIHDFPVALGYFNNPYEADEIVEYLIDYDLDKATAENDDIKIVLDKRYWGEVERPGTIRIDYRDCQELAKEYYVTQIIVY